MPDKWMNPGIGLLAGLLTYMLVSSLLVSGDRGGIVGVGTFIGTFAVVWGDWTSCLASLVRNEPGTTSNQRTPHDPSVMARCN